MSIEFQGSAVFNPLSESVLARTIRQELESRVMERLMPVEVLRGRLVEALYYLVRFWLYDGINDPALNIPLYVGRAQAGSSRMGKKIEGLKTDKLWKRIEKHAQSINASENLELSDFRVRYLVMSDVLSPWADRAASGVRPSLEWRTDGLGSNAHGAGRSEQQMSKWETLHPGRGRTR